MQNFQTTDNEYCNTLRRDNQINKKYIDKLLKECHTQNDINQVANDISKKYTSILEDYKRIIKEFNNQQFPPHLFKDIYINEAYKAYSKCYRRYKRNVKYLDEKLAEAGIMVYRV
jgi:hypothetical protein